MLAARPLTDAAGLRRRENPESQARIRRERTLLQIRRLRGASGFSEKTAGGQGQNHEFPHAGLRYHDESTTWRREGQHR